MYFFFLALLIFAQGNMALGNGSESLFAQSIVPKEEARPSVCEVLGKYGFHSKIELDLLNKKILHKLFGDDDAQIEYVIKEFPFELNEYSEKEVRLKDGRQMVVIGTWIPSDWDYAWLFFYKAGTKWNLMDIIPALSKYVKSECEYIGFGKWDVFRIREGGGGNGGSILDDQLYLINENAIIELKRVPVQGDYSFGLLGMEYQASDLRTAKINGNWKLTHDVDVSYFMNDCDTCENKNGKPEIMFKKRYRYLYTIKNNQLISMLDTGKDIVEDDPENRIGYTDTDEEFFLKHYDDLKVVASQKKTYFKCWFKCFLDQPELKVDALKERRTAILNVLDR
jgi:hypothetical protein